MEYFQYNLDVNDAYQYKQLLGLIQKLRILINKEADEMENEINKKIKKFFELRDQYKLEQFEQVYFNTNDIIKFENQFNNIINNSLNILITKNNQLEYIQQDHFRIQFLQPIIMKLKDLTLQLSCNLNTTKQLIIGNNPLINPQQNIVNNQTSEIWKHKTIAKNGNRFRNFSFKKNQGFAEPFLCKSSFELKGIFLAQLFKGINIDGKQFDFQQNIHHLDFLVHEGLDLSSYYYKQELELNHNKLTKKDYFYEIMLNSTIKFRKGVIYTISLIPNINQNFCTYLYTDGKQGDNQQYLKFLDKHIDLIDQIVIAQQQFHQSPIPGLMVDI